MNAPEPTTMELLFAELMAVTPERARAFFQMCRREPMKVLRQFAREFARDGGRSR